MITFTDIEKENYREILSKGEYQIGIIFREFVPGGGHFFTFAKTISPSTYRVGPFSSLEEVEDFIERREKNQVDTWFIEGGETPFWRIAPSGEWCPPPELSEFGYRTVEGPSNYWWIEKS